MKFIGGLLGIGGSIACCALLFVIVMVGLVVWYWRHQPEQQTSLVAPAPPIQASIEHPTAATTSAPAAAPAATPAAPEPPANLEPPSTTAPPSADA
jgi:hypothetical protein